MLIRCKFVGGPVDRMVGLVSALPAFQLFRDERSGVVSAYRRTDELVYEYDAEASKHLVFDAPSNYVESWA